MSDTKSQLISAFEALPDITVGLWKDSDLLCVFYRGRDFAHFHGDDVLDIRLSPKIIREEALPRPLPNTRHPKRSKNSRWIEVAFTSRSDIDLLVHLVQRTCRETL